MTFDLILKNGRVIDGSGGPPFKADIAVNGTKIAAVGRLVGVAMKLSGGKADAKAVRERLMEVLGVKE